MGPRNLSGAEDALAFPLCWAVIVPALALVAVGLGAWLMLSRWRRGACLKAAPRRVARRSAPRISWPHERA